MRSNLYSKEPKSSLEGNDGEKNLTLKISNSNRISIFETT